MIEVIGYDRDAPGSIPVPILFKILSLVTYYTNICENVYRNCEESALIKIQD